jgi:hypothetical protein
MLQELRKQTHNAELLYNNESPKWDDSDKQRDWLWCKCVYMCACHKLMAVALRNVSVKRIWLKTALKSATEAKHGTRYEERSYSRYVPHAMSMLI